MSPLYNPPSAAVNDFTHVGRYYIAGAVNGLALGTGAPTAGIIRTIPFIAPRRGGVLDTLAYEITGSVAGNTRIGLYENTSDTVLYPAKRLEDSGSIANSAAFKTYAITRALVPGQMYWVAIQGDVAPTIRALGLTGFSSILGSGGAGGALNYGLALTVAYGALPDPFTAGAADLQAVPVPALYFKFSA